MIQQHQCRVPLKGPYSLETVATPWKQSLLPGKRPYFLERVPTSWKEFLVRGKSPCSLETVPTRWKESPLPGKSPYFLERVSSPWNESLLPGMSHQSLKRAPTSRKESLVPGKRAYFLQRALNSWKESIVLGKDFTIIQNSELNLKLLEATSFFPVANYMQPLVASWLLKVRDTSKNTSIHQKTSADVVCYAFGRGTMTPNNSIFCGINARLCVAMGSGHKALHSETALVFSFKRELDSSFGIRKQSLFYMALVQIRTVNKYSFLHIQSFVTVNNPALFFAIIIFLNVRVYPSFFIQNFSQSCVF